MQLMMTQPGTTQVATPETAVAASTKTREVQTRQTISLKIKSAIQQTSDIWSSVSACRWFTTFFGS